MHWLAHWATCQGNVYMYIYIYVCIYICICVYTDIYIHIHTCRSIYWYVYIYIDIPWDLIHPSASNLATHFATNVCHMQGHVDVDVCVCIYVHLYTQLCIYVYLYTHVDFLLDLIHILTPGVATHSPPSSPHTQKYKWAPCRGRYIRICILRCVHIQLSMYTYVYVYTYVHMYMYIHMYI